MAFTSEDPVEESLLRYKDSPSECNDVPTVNTRSPRQRSRFVYTLYGILAGIALATILGTIYVQVTTSQPVALHQGWELEPALRPGEESVSEGPSCGSSPSEARTRGCKFDLNLYAWVPAPCFDEELQMAFQERKAEWWRQRGGKGGEKVPQERVALGMEEALWYSWDYHDYHCQYIWKQMTRLLRNSSLAIPGRMLESYHTNHCIEVLKGIDPGPEEDISTLVTLGYSTCYSRS